MSRSIQQQRQKHEDILELNKDNFIDGTSARTRPFSFNDIILRRNNKKQTENLKEGLGGAEISGSDMIDKVTDPLEYSRAKHVSDDSLKMPSVRKEDKISAKEGKMLKTKDKENLNAGMKLKSALVKNISRDEVKIDKINEKVREKRKSVVIEGRDSEDEYDMKRHSRNLKMHNDFPDKSRSYSERESRSKQQTENDGRWVWGKRKTEELLHYDPVHELDKKHSQVSAGKDKYVDRHSGKYDKESKRKHHGKNDERTRDRKLGRRHISEKWQELEFSGRKEKRDSSQKHHGERNSKRRQSRSRETDDDLVSRSISPSSKVCEDALFDLREHDLTSRTFKGRSGRPNFDADQRRRSNNSLGYSYRQGASESGLGGYSPRKRRSEDDLKTTSSINKSTEKRSAGWDLPPAITDTTVTDSAFSLQPSDQTMQSNLHEFANMTSSPSIVKPVLGALSSASSLLMRASADSVQLTEASRPMRRLYVENLPSSASERALMEYLNNFLVTSGSNLIQGTQPCISCIMHKEKSQALVEFLTPEDASTALSFDGKSFLGSVLKIRRPKDFVEVTSGVHEKAVAAVDMISDIVKDSPHKIFVGGISTVISPEMLREIAGAFGSLRAYRFEPNPKQNEPFAFLEYVDQSNTVKACAGLNGMKLGEKVITVVQVFPDSSSLDNIPSEPFYGIPEHAKPLLEKPTNVLKLKNVLDPGGLSSLSESELEEILEDIRLECARFGTVKSVNIIKCDSAFNTTEPCEDIRSNSDHPPDETVLACDDDSKVRESLEVTECGKEFGTSDAQKGSQETIAEDDAREGISGFDGKLSRAEPSSSNKETIEDEENCTICKVDNLEPSTPTRNEDNEADSFCDDSRKIDMCESALGRCHLTPIDREVCLDSKQSDVEMGMNWPTKNEVELDVDDINTGTASVFCSRMSMNLGAPKEDEKDELVSEGGYFFEPGCVLVEFRRAEASCMAAHHLHGRLFGERLVTVKYVAEDLYREKFPK